MWLPLLSWAGVTPLLHWRLPVEPLERFELPDASAEIGNTRHHQHIAAISPDGNRVLSFSWDARYKFIEANRVWDLKKNELIAENKVNESRDSRWLGGFSRGGWYYLTSFVDWREPGKAHMFRLADGLAGPTLPAGERVISPGGRLVAYREGIPHLRSDNAEDEGLRTLRADFHQPAEYRKGITRILDLKTLATRPAYAQPDAIKEPERASLLPIEPLCFSSDDRLLAGVIRDLIVVLDVETGKIVSTHSIGTTERQSIVNSAQFSPTGEFIAVDFAGTRENRRVIVWDRKTTRRFTIDNAELVGWRPSGKLLVGAERGKTALECWNPVTEQRISAWLVPRTNTILDPTLVRQPLMYAWVAPSPNGQYIAFAQVEGNHGPRTWITEFQRWLGLPRHNDLHLQAYVLDGEFLGELDRWRIDSEFQDGAHLTHYPSFVYFRADSKHLIVAGSTTVEHWPILSRSWFRSTLWAALIVPALLAPLAAWRFWRRRKPATIALNAPPMNPSRLA